MTEQQPPTGGELGPPSEPPQGAAPYGPPPYATQTPPYAPQGGPQYPPPYPQQWGPPPGYPQQWGPPPGYPPQAYAGYQGYQGYPPQWAAPAQPPRPSFPHSEPREYHEMYRTWTYAWWRPVLGIFLLVLGMLVVVPLAMLPVLVIGVLIEGGTQDFLDAFLQAGTLQKLTPSGLLYLNLTLGGLILWCWGLIRVLHQMRPRWLTSVMPKMRWSFFGVCLGLSVVALIAQLAVSLFIPESAASAELDGEVVKVTGTTIALALVILFTTPLQAAGEEYAFRGYLLQAVGSLTRNRWVAILVTSTLFAMAHGFQNFPLFFDRFMFGLVAGWLVIRTGGLEAGIAMHVLNNYLAFGFALVFGSIDETLNVSEVSWWNIPVTLTQSVTFALLVLWAARRMGIESRTRPPVGEAREEAREDAPAPAG